MSKLKVISTPSEILHTKSRHLTPKEITSLKIRTLVNDIEETLHTDSYGVGMSAIQVGQPLAICVIMIRPTPTRPNLKPFHKVYFNLELRGIGPKTPMWEGCCSVRDESNLPVYAKVPRHQKVSIKYIDATGAPHEETVDSFLAHVLQHEYDHTVGILFTDLIDASEIISSDEYHRLMNAQQD